MNHLNDALSEVNGRRRVVQLLAPAHVPGVNLWLNDTCLVALCDDGAIWALRSGNWQPLKGPPGTEGGTP